MKSGHTYWWIILDPSVGCQAFSINLLILTQNEFTNEYSPYPLGYKYDKDKDSIIILHVNENHFLN